MRKFRNVFLSTTALMAITSMAFAEEVNHEDDIGAVALTQYFKPKQAPEFFPQGEPLTVNNPNDGKYPAGYNAPGAIQVDSNLDIQFNAAYTYWYFSQDAMNLASIYPFVSDQPQTSGISATQNGAVLFQDFQYDSGFKAGLGITTRSEGWSVNAEYTWFHNSTTMNVTAPGFDPTGNKPNGYVTALMFAYVNPVTGFYGNVNSTWKMHLDLLDLTAGRPYYQGKSVTVSPKGGVRGLWIRQSLNTQFTDQAARGIFYAVPNPAGAAICQLSSHSWAVGPTGSLNSNWLLGAGFRIESSVGASLLYTRYTTIKNAVSFPDTAVGVIATEAIGEDIGAIRPTFEMGLGLGFGSYAFKNNMHFDLSVRYDFLQFWEQNMMGSYGSQEYGYNNAIGDLSMQGLTANFQVDF